MGELPSGTVTFLLTDIEGSTRQWESRTSNMDQALERHNAILQKAFTSQGGFVITSRGEGDSVFAVFQSARQGVTAAVEAQSRLGEEKWPEGIELKVRMALHTGEADLRVGEYHGHAAINRCGRLRALAHGGQILISATTRDLVYHHLPEGIGLKSLGEIKLKDIDLPERVFQVTHPLLEDDFPPPRSGPHGSSNLPAQLTRFVGRERELAEVKKLLERSRLVTLTGAAGAGKTRLAAQVTAELLDAYEDGICLVELAPLADPALVPQAIAAALALRPPAGHSHEALLLETLREQRVLLLLDNCEHLIDACARLTEALLKTCQRIRILATSREALGIPGEVSWRVPSLAPSEAALLFEDRAALARPGFHLDDNVLPTVESICRRLDGIPLAIELAAARVRMMPPEEIVGRLQDRFRLLTGGSRTALERHQTLRAAVDWSYALLGLSEQALFRALSVFSGSFDLEAAAAVTGESDQYSVMDGLTTLVDKSLLAGEEGSGRFRMLETLRQYGHERLVEAGGAAKLRDRHLDYYLEKVERVGRRDPPGLLPDLDNFRSALEWSLESDPEQGLRLVTILAWPFTSFGFVAEGRARLERLLPKVVEPGPIRAWGLFEAGWFAWWQGDFEVAFRYFDESAAMAEQIHDRQLLGQALVGAGTAAGEGDRATGFTRAEGLLGHALEVFREDGDVQGQASCLQALGIGALIKGDLKRSGELLTACLELRRADPQSVDVAIPLGFLSLRSLQTGELEEAEKYVAEAIAINRRAGNRGGLNLNLGALVHLAGLRGQLELAIRLGAAAEAAQIAMGMQRFRSQLGPERWFSIGRDSLGEARVAELIARGRKLSQEEAVDLASEQLLRTPS